MKHNNPEVAERLRKFVGARGPSPIDTVAPEILPVVTVADLREEQQGGIIIQLFGYVFDAAVAGQYSHVALFNPANSTADIVVQSISLSNSGAASTGYAIHLIGSVAGYTLSTGNQVIGNVPGRYFPNPGVETWGQLYTYTAAAFDPAARLFAINRVGAGNTRQADIETDGALRLQPGFGVCCINGTANSAGEMNIHWHEVIRIVQ